jgi:hypothetical protein
MDNELELVIKINITKMLLANGYMIRDQSTISYLAPYLVPMTLFIGAYTSINNYENQQLLISINSSNQPFPQIHVARWIMSKGEYLFAPCAQAQESRYINITDPELFSKIEQIIKNTKRVMFGL